MLLSPRAKALLGNRSTGSSELFETGRNYYSPVTYQWPDFYNGDKSHWLKYSAFGNALGIVILNRASGDWSEYDADFHKQGQIIKSAGAKRVVFYIKTLYGAAVDPQKYSEEFKQPLSETGKYTHEYIVKTALKVKKEYPEVFGGIFLDEAINGWGDQSNRVQWYVDLYKKLKTALGEDTLIVINPGSNTVERMMDAGDVLMSYESTADKYINPTTPNIHPDHYKTYPSWRFWHVIHDVTEENIVQVFDKAKALGVGHLFATDRVLDLGTGDTFNPETHPYDLPPSPWVVEYVRGWVAGLAALVSKINKLAK